MLKFILRLDDAAPTMNKEKWDKIEKILDKYNIKPIVGIIPDNKDLEFNYPIIENFWQKCLEWQNKGWIIAQHGLNHNLSKTIRTEFVGKSYNEQKSIIMKGYDILKNNGLKPTCFFAPNHTFDDITIKVCNEMNCFKFISDGYAFYPYREKEMMFFPSAFDKPHIISPFGIFTFVYHPNKMNDLDYIYLEKFIKDHINKFEINIDEILNNFSKRKRNIADKILFFSISLLRNIRRKIKKKEN